MIAFFGILGLLAGSFLNVVVLRTKSGKSLVMGRSECPKCHKQLTWQELVPILSYAVQGGKCRGCGAKISPQYPLVEGITGIVFASLYVHFGVASPVVIFSLVVWLVVACLLIAAAVYDWRWMVLPDRLMVPAIAIALGFVIVLAVVFNQTILVERLLAALVFASFFLLLWLFSGGKWLGDGDIRLAIIMGLMLSLQQLIVAIFFSFNLAAIASIWLLATKRKTRKDTIPLGPFLILGTFIGLLVGSGLLGWYLAF